MVKLDIASAFGADVGGSNPSEGIQKRAGSDAEIEDPNPSEGIISRANYARGTRQLIALCWDLNAGAMS